MKYASYEYFNLYFVYGLVQRDLLLHLIALHVMAVLTKMTLQSCKQLRLNWNSVLSSNTLQQACIGRSNDALLIVVQQVNDTSKYRTPNQPKASILVINLQSEESAQSFI